MKKILVYLLVCIFIGGYPSLLAADDALLKQLYESSQGDIQVSGSGEVVRLLQQDNIGSRHQKFIIKLLSGQTLLISHNIDLAPRIEGLKVGDIVKFNGEYEWNSKGGVIHWTHRDPNGQHEDGWLKHSGKKYH